MKRDGLTSWSRIFAGVLALAALSTNCAVAEVRLTLKNSFVEKYKNRATIDTSCSVDKTKGAPNSPSKDGDMHVAVRCTEIGLPLVAELMNAKDYSNIIQATVDAEGSGKSVRIVGAWRAWNEHGGDDTKFVQGKPIIRATTTNPDHAFEIHPIASFDGIAALDSWKPIEGYKAKEADRAFQAYESVRSRIFPGKGVTAIESAGVGYNYVEFQMELNERPYKVEDGSFAFAKVRDWDGHLLLRKKRMVFVKDTLPELAVRAAGEGDCFRVLGIPRLDLALVSWRTKEAAKGRKEVLSWNLPYEIIVVGVYDGECEKD